MKMRLGSLVLLALWLCLLLTYKSVIAYEVSTHTKFSDYAADNSVLATDPTLLGDFGLGPYGTAEFVNSNGDDPTNLRDIIAFGSNFEDDIITGRFFRHFFDPQSGSGLAGFATSPDWALEQDAAGAPLDLQSYSYEDARDDFHAAFTCQTSTCRLDNFSRTFQRIGHVIHHLQDMGQPQHSRLDTHATEPSNFYEKYTATKNDNELVSIMNTQPYAPPPAGANYFNLPRNYWQSGDGKGMAEFSGTNFVTIGTMYQRDYTTTSNFSGHPDFPLPSGAGLVQKTRNVTLIGIGGESFTGDIEFLEGTVFDPLNNITETDVKLAAISVLDAHLDATTFGFPHNNAITVNSQVFDDRYPLLIPRIAAFSTDFINYFFRGRIDMVEETGSANSWQIVNNSTETMSGQFDLYSEASNGDRTILTGWNLTIPAGGSSAPVTFQPPSSSVSNYVLAFRGQLGTEPDAIAGKVLDIVPCTDNCNDCGTALTPAGGQSNQIQSFNYNVSSQFPQELTVFFEAYSIPDQLQVYGNGNLLVDTGGLVSGLNEFSTNYNPSAHGPSLDVQVNAPNNGTAWNFCIDCNSNGEACGTEEVFDTPVTVQFTVTGSGLNCSASVNVTGRTTFFTSISSSSAGNSFYRSLLPGTYNLDLNFGGYCHSGTTSASVGLSVYLDGQQLTSVGWPFSSTTFYIPGVPPVGGN